MRTSILVLVLLAASTGAPAARAADANAPPTEPSVEALLVASKAQMIVEATIGTIEQNLRQSATAATQGRTLTIEQQQAIDASLAKTAKILRDEMSWTVLGPIYAQVYRETFTQKEVDGLIKFFKTPVGTAYVDKTPVVAQKTARLMQQRMASLMPKLQEALQEAAQGAAQAPQ